MLWVIVIFGLLVGGGIMYAAWKFIKKMED